MSREPQWGFRRDAVGIHAIGKSEDEGGAARVRLVLTEQELARTSEPTLRDVWELPLIGVVPGPTAVLIRPDGYVAWVGDQTRQGLVDALTTWFGPPGPVQRDAREIS